MKKAFLAATIAAIGITTVKADTLGIYLGGQVWDSQSTGSFGEKDDQVNFNLANEKQGNFFIAFEHPIPLIPNARISSTTLDTTGMAILTNNINFGDETFVVGSEVNANFNVSYIDYTLYYEFFDNGLFSFDLGITGRDFDGDVELSTMVNTAPQGETPDYTEVSGSISTSEIVPMIYAYTSVGLPFTGLNVYAEGNLLSIDDHTLYDYQVGLSYELIDNMMVDLNLTLGYRSVKLQLEDLNDFYSDLEFKGVFAGAIIHF